VPTLADPCAGKNCGQVWDGCQNVTCAPDACGAGQQCGAGGVANVCGTCQTTTSCGAQGKICGTLWNGCINEPCGSCGDGQRCIGGGTQCCTPKTCADHVGQCGDDIDDGCGGSLHCDCLSESQTCLGGSCCTRRSCQEIAAQVGGDTHTGCVNGPQTNFVECGEIVQCELCAIVLK
jgi:hypothetical protein